jgi:HEAT repeat protein
MPKHAHFGSASTFLVISWIACAAAAPASAADVDHAMLCEWQGPITGVERTIGGLLRQSRQADDAGRARLLAQLSGLGEPACEGLFHVLVEGRVPRSSDDDAAQCLSVPQRELLMAALSSLPAVSLRKVLARGPGDAPAESWNMAAVRLLGAIGDVDDLPELASTLPRDDAGQPTSASRLVLQEAYAGILRRKPRACSRLETLYPSLEPFAADALFKALADVGDGRALPIFLAAARAHPTDCRTVIALVPKLSPCCDVTISLEFAAWLRDRADSMRPEWTRAVFNALGALDEGAAFDQLMDSLDGDVPLRESALAALQRISGASFGPDRRRWEAWYRDEMAWVERIRSGRDDKNRSLSPYEIVQTLRAYSRHKLFRSELAHNLIPLLTNSDPSIRALTCQTLQGLGSPAPLRDLLSLLDDPVPTVSRAAREAITKLTGKPIPAGPAGAARMVLLDDP